MIGISKLYMGTVEPSDALRYGRHSKALPSHLLQFSKDKKPVVVWNMTRGCNLRCVHCYAHAKASGGPDELTTDEGRALIDDLAEFGALTEHYPKAVASGRLWTELSKQGLAKEIGTYALMASLLMRTAIEIPGIQENRWHLERLIEGSPAPLNDNHIHQLGGFRKKAWRAISFIYDKLNLPAWIYGNVCYGNKNATVVSRLKCILRHIFRLKSLQRGFGIK